MAALYGSHDAFVDRQVYCLYIIPAECCLNVADLYHRFYPNQPVNQCLGFVQAAETVIHG